MRNLLLARRSAAIVGVGVFLIASELLAFRSLNRGLDRFAHGLGLLAQRASGVVDLVSAVSKLTTQKAEPSTIVFTRLGSGELHDEDEGIALGFTSYKASDGTGAIAMDYEFAKAETAHAYFEAIKVVDRKDNLNQEGKIVGERAQILIPVQPEENELAVLWTDGKIFREICSSSLKNILELEKLYRR